VDPRFERAVAEFSKDLRAVRAASDPEVELRRTVRLLAIALERVPYAGKVDVELAASRIRGGRSRGRATPYLAYGVAGESRAVSTSVDVERSLQVVSDTFGELARGPYRTATGLIGEVYELDAAVRGVGNGNREQRRCDRAVRALEQAEVVLLSMRAAVGRGEVGLTTRPPPPVAWGP
jgi:hypothetical protein